MTAARIDMIDAMYRGEYRSDQGLTVSPPWEIGAPQPAVVALVETDRVAGRVLDAGCGTGQHARYLAAAGHHVVAVDGAPTAIALARARAAELATSGSVASVVQHLSSGRPGVVYEVADATELPGHVDEFDTVLDVGLLHCLDAADQERYVAALHRACRPDATVYILCSTRAVTPERLHELFGDGWDLAEPVPSTLVGKVPEDPRYRGWGGARPGEITELPAWLVSARRL
jgi:SAM-dependent methyltransferase